MARYENEKKDASNSGRRPVQLIELGIRSCRLAGCSGIFPLITTRQNLQPVVVWVFAKVDSHIGILETDATHFLVKLVCCIEVVHSEGQVEFVITKVVWLLAVAKPSQLQLMCARAVLKIDDDETAVFGIDATNLVHAERPVVEFEAAIKVKHVEVVVNHLKFHGVRLLVCC